MGILMCEPAICGRRPAAPSARRTLSGPAPQSCEMVPSCAATVACRLFSLSRRSATVALRLFICAWSSSIVPWHVIALPPLPSCTISCPVTILALAGSAARDRPAIDLCKLEPVSVYRFGLVFRACLKLVSVLMLLYVIVSSSYCKEMYSTVLSMETVSSYS